MNWLPDDFVHPVRVPVLDGYFLRPISGADTELDYPAVMGSRERLWSIYGQAWGWPPAEMTFQQDYDDLVHHAVEIEAHESFNYALFDEAETALLGCVYIDPARKAGYDAEVSWWVVDSQVGTELEQALDATVPRWLAEQWPFTKVGLIGTEINWDEWLALPDRD
ncbi:N-acetyltransferase [Kitasatospora sp. NPDC002227]|uniref:N-acetyltransferase n=1 Tax=Kitasatospora sp. NPDC002227 TaxID=3154773 RepID=UPI0033220A8F